MKNRPYFVIFAAMRTGSNLLEKTLEGLGDTCCYGEAFNPGFIGGPKTKCLFGCDVEERDRDPEGFLTMLRGEAGEQIPGFRIFDEHAPDLVPHLAQDPACRRIVLKRDPLSSYLSLLAARETGQWLLRNAHRRKEVRVRFDAVEFEFYRERLAVHYAWFDAKMKEAGTDALRLDYEDLQDRAVLTRAARFIGSLGEVPEDPPLVRQNPGRLPDRVINYAEMCSWLGMNPEPRTPPPLPVAEDIQVSRNAPAALAMVDGPGGDAGLSLLYRIEARNYGSTRLTHAQLSDPSARQSVFLSGLSADVLDCELARRKLIAMVCHPATRMHQLFLGELFGPAWHASVVRRHLVRRCGGVPSPKELSEGEVALEPQRHRELFLGFLDLVAAVQEGEGPLPPQRAWHSQASLLDGYQKLARVDIVASMESLADFAIRLAAALETDPLPAKHVAAILDNVLRADLPFAEIVSQDILDRLRELYAIDFARFGYGDWPVNFAPSSTVTDTGHLVTEKFASL